MNDERKTEAPGSSGRMGDLTSDLAARIERAQGKRLAAAGEHGGAGDKNLSGWGRGMRLSSEFVAAIIVGAGIGYVLDLWLNTTPWLMLLMLMMGFAAGVLNVIRAAAQMDKADQPPAAATGVPDDEEKE
ncbi:AtpZ/AtpI family protein [Devosia sp.]|uniref:AtpZ/AtpI family protein n=1 Tax=Devosia sp. TaxID=1871048 RepID=UPI003A8CC8E5